MWTPASPSPVTVQASVTSDDDARAPPPISLWRGSFPPAKQLHLTPSSVPSLVRPVVYPWRKTRLDGTDAAPKPVNSAA